MSVFNRIEEIVRNTDTAFLDEHWAWDTDPHQITTELVNAHRAEVAVEVLHAAVDVAAVVHQHCHREVCAGCEVRRAILDDLRSLADVLGEKGSPAGADATPDFFQPGHTYAREHHAATIRFLVTSVSWSPDGTYRAAHGWRIEDGDVTWSPSDSDDFEGWTEVTEGGAR